MNKITVSIITLGCRVNQYESCAIADALTQLGFIVNKHHDSDYYIINTCAVTAESQRKSKQMVRRFAEKGKVLVIGCASQLDESFAEIDNVVYLGGNRRKMDVVDYIYGVFTKQFKKQWINHTTMDDAPYEDMFLLGKNEIFSSCRAFIKIQDGCNGKCTYCIIPKCRGKVRSRDPEYIIEESKRLIEWGYKEIILTGIEVSAYNKIPLKDLIVKVSATEGLERLRLGSLSPNVITEIFMETVSSCPNFMPHIHLSLQSCCDSVLTAMKRPYRKKDIIDKVALIRKYIPECIITADIIVGFPGETEDDFLETSNALEELGIFHVHSFPYSEREGTPAATMENSVPKNIRAKRNIQLISRIEENKKRILSTKYNKTLSVLIEKIENGFAIGHSQEFMETKFADKSFSVSDIVKVKIVSQKDGILIGESI